MDEDLIDVYRFRFLDPENPVPNKQIFNDLILEQGESLSALFGHVSGEEAEGRSLIVQINTGSMPKSELESLSEWEP